MNMKAVGKEDSTQPFERWIAVARPPAKLWRVGVGAVIGLACWFAVSVAITWGYYFGWLLLGDETSPAFRAEMNGLATGSTHTATLVLLLASGGFWLAAYLVALLMHRQKFWSLVSADRRVRWRDFGLGALFTLVLMVSDWVLAPLLPVESYRNETNLVRWSLFAVPVAGLVFIQAAGEELFFRGYLMQRLAARWRNPLIWGLLPSVVFGALHFFNGVSLEHSLIYVASTILFGLTAAATVWRTGGLSVAIGMHVTMNVWSLLFAGADNFFTATPLWLGSVYDQIEAAPYTLFTQVMLLAFVLSPRAPLPKRQLFPQRNETRAEP